ncbi:ferric reductase-like transmembrane domain-containing protein [Halodurantibacterium flavum]|uniref:Ferric reductase-like transmembrane domain-containing protein n=1 Tax=Halodurantibacterium flavum TaxID=1382802 RepID=A0ABW4S209_9RHOB
MISPRLVRCLAWTGSALPGLLILGRWQVGLLGVVPTEALLHQTGRLALFFLMASLAVGFLHFLSGWNPIVAARRPLGVWCFLYALAHLLIWLILDQGHPAFAWAEARMMRHVQLGLAAFLLLAPLALSSSDRALRWLTHPVWRRLHLLVWPAAALALGHAWAVSRFENPRVMVMAALLVMLAMSRIGWTLAHRLRNTR